MGVEISVHYIIARGWCAACAVGLFAVGMTQLMAISWQIALVMVTIIIILWSHKIHTTAVHLNAPLVSKILELSVLPLLLEIHHHKPNLFCFI